MHEKNSPEPTTDANGNLVVGGGLGGHWDPDNTQKHAGPDGDGHRGDLDALTINDDGSINQVIISAKIKYGDVKGRSFVIHANPIIIRMSLQTEEAERVYIQLYSNLVKKTL